MVDLSIDIETFSSVDIKKSGLYRYVQASDFEVLLFAYSFNGKPVQIVDLTAGDEMPEEILKSMDNPNVVKHAYNASFEWYCLSKFFGKWLPLEQWRCTMLHGLYCGYTAGLAATGEALGLPQNKRKLSTGLSLIRTFCV
jgi:DNA polymerase